MGSRAWKMRAISPDPAESRGVLFSARSTSRFSKQIVAHEPLLAPAIAPKFGAAHVEDSPIGPPFFGLRTSVGLREERHDFRAMRVHIAEPVLGGALIMRAVHFPVGHCLEVVLKLQQQIVRGHLSAGEKITAHPVAGTARHEM